MKKCCTCKKDKPTAEFNKYSKADDGLQPRCRECQAAARRSYTLAQYSLDEEGFQALLVEQGGVCAICRSDSPGKRWDRFAIDHCHETGKVRGLLCGPCNVSIGQIGDNTHALYRAYQYLKHAETR